MPPLRATLPLLLPRAIAWAEALSEQVLRTGQPLDEGLGALAREVGVARPGEIRIQEMARVPLPDDPLLQQAMAAIGFLGQGMAGLTLGHAVIVTPGLGRRTRLLSHEFRHVHQYEQAGSLAAFLETYLEQIVTFGYVGAPLERDARAHEREA